MKSYVIYKNVIANSFYNKLNKEGWSILSKEGNEKEKAMFEVSHHGSDVWNNEYFDEYYEVVGQRECVSLTDVYCSGGINVGDVAFDVAKDKYYLCDNIGWTELFGEVA